MPRIVVQKFGGSSVADIEKIKKVAEKVVDTKKKGFDVVVVVSAMGKTTDSLLEMARMINPSPSSRELDMLLSVGERITMALLSMAIQALGVDAISFTGSQCGIITNASHTNARIIEVRPFRVLDELAQDKIVIVAGYQGVSYKREITTLGRGGSDTTAVALAAALGAERCEIYSDIEGVYTADPKVVLDAKKLETVSFEEMLELSRLGAKVLNADAVEFARRAGIAIYTKSSFDPNKSGTIIRLNAPPIPRQVVGVAWKKSLVGFEVSSSDFRNVIVGAIGEERLDIDFVVAFSNDRTFLVLRDGRCVDLECEIKKVCENVGAEYQILRNLATVSIVGAPLSCLEARSDFLDLVWDEKCIIGIVGTPNSLTFLVREEQAEDFARAVHKTCFPGETDRGGLPIR
jgi:aspartate kinase